ncbi:MAG: YIP1 family protein, partial [Clostridia bacterium]
AIVDVALGPNGMWSIIDKKRSRVFTYGSDGDLLFAFGDMGDQVGNIQSLVALSYQGSNLLLADSTKNSVTVFTRTSYGDLLAAALQNTQDQNYSKAVNYYVSILQRNNNFDAAYIGIGDSLYRNGHFNEAMQQYKFAYNQVKYSEAYTLYRKEWIEKWVLLIPVAIIAVCVLLSLFFKYANKVNKAGHVYKEKHTIKEELLYAFHIIFHPFDGFWDLKHENRGGIRGATIILLTTIAVFIYQAIGRGYMYNMGNHGVNYILEIFSVVVPLFLWVLANWCLTTLFDGEGTFKDIYIASCYSLTPLPMLILPTVFLSNIVTANEMSLLALVSSAAFAWMGMLLIFGMMVIHDYTLGKNILTVIGTVVGAAFIMFVTILFFSLIAKMFTFGYNIYAELAFRFS